MDQPIEDTSTTGKGIKIAALRISGFQVKEEKPKKDTSELDAWAAEVIRKAEQGEEMKKSGKNPPKKIPKDA